MTAPDWLKERGGAFKQGSDGKWYVVLDGKPSYSLLAVPAAGKFACTIRQTINGTRIDCPEIHASQDEALAAGLSELRSKLGWG
jgi:hypothetical protein